MRRSNQGGSLAGFIIIGAVLALVLVGGLYGINRYNAEQNKTIASSDESKKETEPKKDDAKKDEKSSDTPIPNDATTIPSTNMSTEEAKDQVAAAQQLPQTGPADMVLQLIAIASLSFATVYYARSRAYAHSRTR